MNSVFNWMEQKEKNEAAPLSVAAVAPGAPALKSWAGVFDLDETLGDFRALIGGALGELYETETPGINLALQQRARELFVQKVAKKELDKRGGAHGGMAACIVRPDIERILYTLRAHPSCEGLIIVSNNRSKYTLEFANDLLFEITRQRASAGGGAAAVAGGPGEIEMPDAPPFLALVHHGHNARAIEYEYQKKFRAHAILPGSSVLYNNTTKSLSTVKAVFAGIPGKEEFAASLGEPSAPYSLRHARTLRENNVNNPPKTPEELFKTDRVLFADDLYLDPKGNEGISYAEGNNHQLIYELENPAVQFINCTKFNSVARKAEFKILYDEALAEAGYPPSYTDFFSGSLLSKSHPPFTKETTNWDERIEQWFAFLATRGAGGGGRRIRRKQHGKRKQRRVTRRKAKARR